MRLDEILSNSCTLLGIYEYKFNTLTINNNIMTFKTNISASDEAKYLDADSVKTERTCLSKDGKSTVLWKIGTEYYVEINTYYDENFWQGEDNAFERSEYIVEVKKLTDEEVEEYFEAYKSYEPALYE